MAQLVPTTEEGVANLALGLLQESPIASLDDDNPRARRAKQWFAIARDETLREKDWNFATAYVTPAAEATAGPGVLETRYALPADCVKVRSVEDLAADEWALESLVKTVSGAAVEVTALVANITAPNICYTRRVTNFSVWDPQAIVAFSKRLAAYMAPAFGKSFDESDAMEKSADRKISAAATTDAREKARTTISRDTSWTRSRTGGRWRT